MDNTPDQPLEAAIADTQPTQAWPDPPIAEPPSTGGLFFGRFGLRAGYGIAIFIIVGFILTAIAGIAGVASTGHLREIITARQYTQAHPHAAQQSVHIDFRSRLVIVNDGVNFLGLLFVCWFFSKGERRPMRAYGISAYRFRDILPGAFWGLAMMSTLILILKLAGFLVFDSRALSGATILVSGLKWLLAFLLVGFSEEYTFRGYLQYTLTRGVFGLAEKISATNSRAVAFWLAATILSGLFATVHLGNKGENFFGIVQVFAAGMLFAYALWRTGSLWWGIGYHMTWDWAQSFLYGVPDSANLSVGRLFNTHPVGKTWLSGGSAGPEGSVFATVFILLTFAAIHLTHAGTQPALEPEPKAAPPPEFHNAVA